jgi:hypothetical protein
MTCCSAPNQPALPACSAPHRSMVRWGNLKWPWRGNFGWPSGGMGGLLLRKPRLGSLKSYLLTMSNTLTYAPLGRRIFHGLPSTPAIPGYASR